MKKNNKRKNQSRAFCEMRYKFNEARRMEALKAVQEDMNFVDCYDKEGNYLGIANEDIKPNGNGPQLTDNDNYVTAYQMRKKKWLDNFKESHDVTSKFLAENKEMPPHKYIRKRPWYILLKRESVPMCKKLYKSNKLNRTELMEGYVQHKLKKWEAKNPCPVKKDDMFYSQQYPIWAEKKQSAEERLRDLVINKYTNKLSLVGRFETNENNYEEHEVAKIVDKFGETTKAGGVNNLSPKSKVMRKAQHLTNITKKKHPKCVCTNLKDHMKQRGRILFPQMRTAA